jgi:2-dehydropantoate 2-reductase
MSKLRVLSIGAGAIGTYIGGSLVRQNHELIFVEKPEVVAKLRNQGLRLSEGITNGKTDGKPISVSLDPKKFLIVSSIAEAIEQGSFDIALFALKSYDTTNFISTLQASISNIDSLPPFLCLSNGVGNEPALEEFLGSDKVIAGTVTSAIARRDAGDIVLERLRGVGVAATHPISNLLVKALNNAGLNARLYARPQDMKWSKMLTNLIANASSAILDMPPADIFAYPELYNLEIQQLRETLAVMQAQNIEVVDLPGTPVRLLAIAVNNLPTMISRPFLRRAVGTGRGGKMPSFHIDLHHGRGKSEVDFLNGAVVRFGKENGIPTPVNEILTETLLKLTSGEYDKLDFAGHPERLLSIL